MRSRGRINNFVGHRLREIRRSRNLTLQEVARRAGIAAGSYSCLENGWYNINLDNLFKILYVLKAEVVEVWPRVEARPGEVIDDEYLKEATRAALASMPRPLTLDDVYESISGTFHVDKRQLLSQSRWQPLTEARGACGILVKDIPTLSLTSLCRSLGCSISSMSHLVRRTSERVLSDATLSDKLRRARRDLEHKFPPDVQWKGQAATG